MRSRTIKRQLRMPLYSATVWVVLCDDIAVERSKFNDLLGEYDAHESETGLCSWRNQHYALFFRRDQLCMNIVAHECFHAAHRISEWASLGFDSDHHEATALIMGWLVEHVVAITKPKPGLSHAS